MRTDAKATNTTSPTLTTKVPTPSPTPNPTSSLKTSKKNKKGGSKKSKGKKNKNDKAQKNGKKSKSAAPTSSPTVSLLLISTQNCICLSIYFLLHILSNCCFASNRWTLQLVLPRLLQLVLLQPLPRLLQ